MDLTSPWMDLTGAGIGWRESKLCLLHLCAGITRQNTFILNHLCHLYQLIKFSDCWLRLDLCFLQNKMNCWAIVSIQHHPVKHNWQNRWRQLALSNHYIWKLCPVWSCARMCVFIHCNVNVIHSVKSPREVKGDKVLRRSLTLDTRAQWPLCAPPLGETVTTWSERLISLWFVSYTNPVFSKVKIRFTNWPELSLLLLPCCQSGVTRWIPTGQCFCFVFPCTANMIHLHGDPKTVLSSIFISWFKCWGTSAICFASVMEIKLILHHQHQKLGFQGLSSTLLSKLLTVSDFSWSGSVKPFFITRTNSLLC